MRRLRLRFAPHRPPRFVFLLDAVAGYEIHKPRNDVSMNETPEEARTSRVQIVLTESERAAAESQRGTVPLAVYLRDAALRKILPSRRPAAEYINGRDLNIPAVRIAAARMARGEDAMSVEDMRRVLIGTYGNHFDLFDNVRIVEGHFEYGQFAPEPLRSPDALTTTATPPQATRHRK